MEPDFKKQIINIELELTRNLAFARWVYLYANVTDAPEIECDTFMMNVSINPYTVHPTAAIVWIAKNNDESQVDVKPLVRWISNIFNVDMRLPESIPNWQANPCWSGELKHETYTVKFIIEVGRKTTCKKITKRRVVKDTVYVCTSNS
jgi:hypothetical protein